jgi:hypothetical protein
MPGEQMITQVPKEAMMPILSYRANGSDRLLACKNSQESETNH